ncbi:MAG: nucleotidyltransferase family protein [Trueperaceae bacterium]
MPQLHAIVMAAGQATRFGAHKLLLPAGPGQTLVSRAVSAALAGADGDVVVVLGRDARRVRLAVTRSCLDADPRAESRLRFQENPGYREGLGTSVSTGVRRLMAEAGEADGAMLLLGDQPLVSAEQARLLAQAFRDRGEKVLAVAAAAGGKRRNPVVVSADLFPELLRLAGAEGARSLLTERHHLVERLDFGDGPWWHDIDSWDDYAALARSAGWEQESRSEPRRLELASLPLPVRSGLERLTGLPTQVLAPGVLFATRGNEVADFELPADVDGRGEGFVVVELSRSKSRGDSPGAPVVALGNGGTDGEYLSSLRAAALWALANSSSRNSECPSATEPNSARTDAG